MQGSTDFPKIQEQLENSRFQKSHMKEVHTDDPEILGATMQNVAI
jgi:hypothetical protein